jgi:hypothetical protein
LACQIVTTFPSATEKERLTAQAARSAANWQAKLAEQRQRDQEAKQEAARHAQGVERAPQETPPKAGPAQQPAPPSTAQKTPPQSSSPLASASPQNVRRKEELTLDDTLRPTNRPAGQPNSGNGCGGIGVGLIDAIEKIAADMNRPGGPTSCPKTGCGPVPDSAENFNKLLKERLEELRLQSGYNSRDLLAPKDGVSEETMRKCLPNTWKFVEKLMAHSEEADRRANRAKLPVNRLILAYYRYSIIQQCHQEPRASL